MNIRDPRWRYVPVKYMGPGYLARKFAKIRAEQAAKAAANPQNVRAMPIRKAAK